MQQYHQVVEHVLKNGVEKSDRTSTGTLSLFGHQMRFDLSKGFPLLTTKKVHFKSIVYELLWFLKGESNVAFLKQNGVSIWNEWADASGDLGPVYGVQWRSWQAQQDQTIDQISWVQNEIRENPNSRRLVVSAWNVGEISKMALPPCHCFFQFYVSNGKLSCQLYQRSADLFLGVPFNIASYALLTHLMAQACGLEVGEFIHSLGDIHLYKNHIEQTKELLSRGDKEYSLPLLKLNSKKKDIFDFEYSDIELVGYQYHPAISAQVSV